MPYAKSGAQEETNSVFKYTLNVIIACRCNFSTFLKEDKMVLSPDLRSGRVLNLSSGNEHSIV